MTALAPIVLAAVVFGTWNGEWFPSGRAEHRANPAVEAATVATAGDFLARGIARIDPAGTNDLVLCFNEIRDAETAEALRKAIGRADLKVAIVSGYRRRDRFDMQQDVLMTTLPVAESGWCRWKNFKADTPPRGYVHAAVVVSPAVTASVYAVHLKSNYGQTTEAAAESNRRKREIAIGQLVAQEAQKRGRAKYPVVIAGDFNADRFSAEFAKETFFSGLFLAGFRDAFELSQPHQRITHPGRGKWGNSTLDYIMFRGARLLGSPLVVSSESVSDHNPVFATLDFDIIVEQDKAVRQRQ